MVDGKDGRVGGTIVEDRVGGRIVEEGRVGGRIVEEDRVFHILINTQ